MCESEGAYLVSVIIPVYNVERYLARCIESVLVQSYADIEIILVNDGSTDGSLQICETYEKKDRRLRLINKENQGLSSARNAGLAIARGEYVVFIDSDDWIGETHIERLFTAISESTADAVIGAHTKVYSDKQKQVAPVKVAQGLYRGEEIVNQIVLPLLGPDPFYPDDVQFDSSACMNMYSMSVIRKEDLWFQDEKKYGSEDLLFNLDFLMHSQCVTVSDVVDYYYFDNRKSLSRKYYDNRITTVSICFLEMEKKICQYGLVEKARLRAERTFLMKVRTTIRSAIVSDLSLKNKCSAIEHIICHDVTRKVIEMYPIMHFNYANRLLMTLIRRKAVIGVHLLMILREFVVKNAALKKVIKQIGRNKSKDAYNAG